MSRFYSLDDANALLPDLSEIVERLRQQRDELVGLRDAYRDRETTLLEHLIAEPAESAEPAAPAAPIDPADNGDDDPELRRLRLRMRGIVDQMQADVAWLDERSIVLRDISSGLLDLPALASGRQVWLCWRLGESDIGFWHGHDEGFAGRRPLTHLPGDSAQA